MEGIALKLRRSKRCQETKETKIGNNRSAKKQFQNKGQIRMANHQTNFDKRYTITISYNPAPRRHLLLDYSTCSFVWSRAREEKCFLGGTNTSLPNFSLLVQLLGSFSGLGNQLMFLYPRHPLRLGHIRSTGHWRVDSAGLLPTGRCLLAVGSSKHMNQLGWFFPKGLEKG